MDICILAGHISHMDRIGFLHWCIGKASITFPILRCIGDIFLTSTDECEVHGSSFRMEWEELNITTPRFIKLLKPNWYIYKQVNLKSAMKMIHMIIAIKAFTSVP